MRIRILGLVALVFMMELLPLSAKEKIKPEYAVALIDSSLRKDAWAVCREYNHEFVLENESKAAERVHLVITVFSKAGD